jgi:hypothetical protein
MRKKEGWSAKDFTDTNWASAELKAKFANNLRAFVESGFDDKKFTAALYDRLSRLFGHIAEYNKDGFWNAWFSSPAGHWNWIQRVRTHEIYGDPGVTWSDVEHAVQKWLNDVSVYSPVEARAKAQIEKEERDTLRWLLKKYPEEATDSKWSEA